MSTFCILHCLFCLLVLTSPHRLPPVCLTVDFILLCYPLECPSFCLVCQSTLTDSKLTVNKIITIIIEISKVCRYKLEQ